MTLDNETPIPLIGQTVNPDWVDFNGHMNVAYYVVVFDRCVDALYNRLGIGPEKIGETNRSVFTLEAHVNYLNEVMQGDELSVEGRLLDFDEKRVHTYFEMYKGTNRDIVAAMEQIGIHVDMNQRRPALFGEQEMRSLERMKKAHRVLSDPEYAGRVIGIPVKRRG